MIDNFRGRSFRALPWARAIVIFGGMFMADQGLSLAEAPTGRISEYQIESRGFRVGGMKTSQQPMLRDGRPAIRFRSTMAISASFLFFSKKSSSSDDAVVGDSGTVAYRHASLTDGRTKEVVAHFTDGQTQLQITEHYGKPRSIIFRRESYDFTTMDCPEMSLLRPGDEREIRLLDLENARVVKRKYHWRKNEEMSIDNRKIVCRVIDFEDPDNRCRRWITQDERGVLIVRQEGKSRSGSYLLSMTGLRE